MPFYTSGSRQEEYRAGGRAHTPCRVAQPPGRQQLPRGSSTYARSDCVRVRAPVTKAERSLGEGLVAVADALVRIGREEGLNGLYKGVGPSLLLVSHGALQFMTYEELKRRMAAWRVHAQPLAAAATALEDTAHDTGRSSPSPTTHDTTLEPSSSASTRRGVELVRLSLSARQLQV